METLDYNLVDSLESSQGECEPLWSDLPKSLHWDRNKYCLNRWGLRIHDDSGFTAYPNLEHLGRWPTGARAAHAKYWRHGLGRGWKEERTGGQAARAVAVTTYSEDMKEDSGPTSFAFWRACFSLKAASASSSSWLGIEPKTANELFLILKHNRRTRFVGMEELLKLS